MPNVNATMTTSERILFRQTFFHEIDQIIFFEYLFV
jgi:hypothetical protein